MSRGTSADGLCGTLIAFFERLETIGPLLQLVAVPLRVEIELLARPPRRVVLDFTDGPLRVGVDDRQLTGSAGLSAAPGDLHALLLGRLPVFAGVDQRRLLLRGSMGDLLRFFPLLELTPLLYAEHLAGGAPPARPWRAGRAAGLLGRSIARVPRRRLLSALGPLMRGVQRVAPGGPPPALPPRRLGGNPLDPPSPRPMEQLSRAALEAVGRAVGLARFRGQLPRNLWGPLQRLSVALARVGPSDG